MIESCFKKIFDLNISVFGMNEEKLDCFPSIFFHLFALKMKVLNILFLEIRNKDTIILMPKRTDLYMDALIRKNY